jgi:hypothetical protein
MDSSRDLKQLTVALFAAFLIAVATISDWGPVCPLAESWGPTVLAGCLSISAILNVELSPPIPCLDVDVDNTNGGVLLVSNYCDSVLVMGGLEIGPSIGPINLDVLQGENGEFRLTPASRSFATYIPLEHQWIKISGRLGSETVTLRFTKTKALF